MPVQQASSNLKDQEALGFPDFLRGKLLIWFILLSVIPTLVALGAMSLYGRVEVSFMLSLLAELIAVALFFLVTGPTLRPLYHLVSDLQSRVEHERNLRDEMKEAIEASDITSTISQIMASAEEQAASSTQQAAAINQTTSTAEELRQTAEQAAERAKRVSEVAKESIDIAEQGRKAVIDTVEGMKSIKEQTKAIAQNILVLSERSQQIGEIIALVDEIAEQSNLLALNAAIEAARAGEAGRGFSVVASEVRNLAEQSRQATAQVNEILREIQKQTNVSVLAMEEGNKRVDRGMELAQRAGEAIETITARVKDAAQAAHQIAVTANQQLVGVDQIATAMQQINQAAEESKRGIEQIEHAARSFKDLAERLNKVLSRHKLS